MIQYPPDHHPLGWNVSSLGVTYRLFAGGHRVVVVVFRDVNSRWPDCSRGPRLVPDDASYAGSVYDELDLAPYLPVILAADPPPGWAWDERGGLVQVEAAAMRGAA